MARLSATLKSHLLKLGITSLVLVVFSLVYLDAWLLEKFEEKKWSLPATVYARPLELFEGYNISMQAVMRELDAAGYKRAKSIKPGSYQVVADSLRVNLRSFLFWDGMQAEQKVIISFNNGRISRLQTDIKDRLSVRLEPIQVGRLHPDKIEERLLVTLEQAPDSLVEALLVTEDREFFDHHGISIKSIVRALFANVKEGRVVQGGSTLTQQLVKNFFLNAERSYGRKILEALMAILLEFHASKEEILEAYINEVFVAQDGARAIHGFGLASQYLFSKSLEELSIHETALLVAMLKGPSYYNPLRHPERALQRRNLILQLMSEQGSLSVAEAETAKARSLGVRQSQHVAQYYPAYLDLVRRQLRRDYSQKALTTEGLRIFSNMDPQWQWLSQKSLNQRIDRLERDYASAVGIDGGVVMVDTVTGDVLAVVGSRYSRVAGFNRALDAKRPIGSLVKPAIYLAALQEEYTLASVISDEPITVSMPQGDWIPDNYDGQSHGNVLLYEALAKSYNIAAVRTGMDVGVGKVIQMLKRLGIKKPMAELPSLLLGSLELSPFEVSQFYATLANQGFYSPLKSIKDITDRNGKSLRRYPFRIEQKISSDYMHLIDYALQTVIHEGTAKSVRDMFPANAVVAGKTGTSNGSRDSWFAGYDANKMAVVWMGRDDNSPLPVTGSTGALPVWATILASNKNTRGRAIVPRNVSYQWIDSETGKLSKESCKGAVYIPFIHGTEPNESVSCTITPRSIIHWFKKWFQ